MPGPCWVCGDRNHIARNCTSGKWSTSSRSEPRKRTKNAAPIYVLGSQGSPNTISIRIGSRFFRALVDTGAEFSVAHSRVFKSIKPRPDLFRKSINLKTANGSRLRLKGETSLEFKVGEQRSWHDYFVVENLNRNVILGRDWLKNNQVRIYNDLNALRFKGEYVALQEDKRIPSLVRLQRTLVLKPPHAYTCLGRIRIRTAGRQYQIEEISSGFFSQLAGVSVASSVVTANESRRVPILIMNGTNQTIRLKRGCPVERLREASIVSSIELANRDNYRISDKELEWPTVPKEFGRDFRPMLRKNSDLFTNADKYLGVTDSVKMSIDTEGPPRERKPRIINLLNRERRWTKQMMTDLFAGGTNVSERIRTMNQIFP